MDKAVSPASETTDQAERTDSDTAPEIAPPEQPRVRFTTRELFVVTAFCAVFAWCASMVGFDNRFFWIAFVANLLMVALFVKVGRSEEKRWAVVLVPVPFLLFCLCSPIFSSVALGTNALLLIVAGLVTKPLPRLSTKCLWTITAATTATAFVVAVWFGMWRSQFLYDLREEFSIQSLAPRLEYEKQAGLRAVTQPLGATVTHELVEFETELSTEAWGREDELRSLHGGQVEHFLRQSGFGVGRMGLPRRTGLGTPSLLEIPYASSHEPVEHNLGFSYSWRITMPPRFEDPLEKLHKFSRIDFLYPDGFGATFPAKGKDLAAPQVAGFVEHAFHWSPIHKLDMTRNWQLIRLELVSLLKFDEPRVYVLDHLPRMDQLSGDNVPTRGLDAFESAALEKLWSQEDLVINDPVAGDSLEVTMDEGRGSDTDNTVRMLGSLRAAQQCLDCHGVKRGELLGAFSYELRRLDTTIGH